MKEFFAYLRSKYFFLNMGLIILSIVLVLFFAVKWLSVYTQHGETVDVPDFKGKNLKELDAFANGKDIRYQVIDSIYDPKSAPGTVLRQDPEAKTKVKRNRTVYLYVTGLLPPQLSMPKLVDRSERQAISMIESYGLKVGRVTQVKGDCNGCVLSQSIKGKEVEPGTMVKKGSVIDISVGKKEHFATATDTTATGNDPGFD
jgi:eukaryotic-like serine/threonine-protein kinase